MKRAGTVVAGLALLAAALVLALLWGDADGRTPAEAGPGAARPPSAPVAGTALVRAPQPDEPDDTAREPAGNPRAALEPGERKDTPSAAPAGDGPLVSGRVVDEGGRPLPDITVQLLSRAGNTGSTARTGERVLTSISDEAGRYAFRRGGNIPTLVRASHPSFGRGEVPVRDVANQDDLVLPDLVLFEMSVLAGRVVCADGAPVAGTRVTAVASTGESLRPATLTTASTRTESDGSFVLRGLDPGEYELALVRIGRSFGPYPTGSQNLELVSPARQVRVRIEDTEGAVLNDVRLELYVELEPETSRAGVGEGRAAERWENLWVIDTNEGQGKDSGVIFSLDVLRQAPPYRAIAYLSRGDLDLGERELVLAGRTCFEDVTVRLDPEDAGGTLRVSFPGSRLEDEATWYLERVSPLTGHVLSSRPGVGPTATFAVRDATTDVRLRFRTNAGSPHWFLDPYLTGVTTYDDRVTPLEVALRPGGRIELRTTWLGAERPPTTRMHCVVTPIDDPLSLDVSWTIDGGRQGLELGSTCLSSVLPAGAYDLRIVPVGGQEQRTSVVLSPGQATRVEVAIEPKPQ